MSESQKAFEAWFAKIQPNLTLHPGVTRAYSVHKVQIAWETWQAAIAWKWRENND